MSIERFEDLIAWQKSKELSVSIYKSFHEHRDLAFKDQIQRAAVSIMNNIAEGFERRSNKEFRQFLFIAKGSCAEVRSMLYLAMELDKINQEKCKSLLLQSEELGRILGGLIKSLP